jgi:hypothetical protein
VTAEFMFVDAPCTAHAPPPDAPCRDGEVCCLTGFCTNTGGCVQDPVIFGGECPWGELVTIEGIDGEAHVACVTSGWVCEEPGICRMRHPAPCTRSGDDAFGCPPGENCCGYGFLCEDGQCRCIGDESCGELTCGADGVCECPDDDACQAINPWVGTTATCTAG